MKHDHGFRSIGREIATWWTYVPEVKCRCFSQACVHQNNLTLIDPIRPVDKKKWEQILRMGNPTLIILTNGNHERDAVHIQDELKIPIACGEGAVHPLNLKPEIILDGHMQIHGLRPVPAPGAGPGEIALFCQPQQTMFFGDIIVNLPDTGLAPLPEKYASNPQQMLQSIRSLTDFSFSRACFAHGTPLESQARSQIRALIQAAAS